MGFCVVHRNVQIGEDVCPVDYNGMCLVTVRLQCQWVVTSRGLTWQKPHTPTFLNYSLTLYANINHNTKTPML
jgi:hypothetical protein